MSPEASKPPVRGTSTELDRARRAMFVAGLLISALMLVRGEVGGDQLDLLARGWRLAAHHDLVPYGNPLSNGGDEPGALTSVVVGLPLMLWRDHRAPAVLIWLTHLLAFALIDRSLRPILSPRGRLLFCLLYWLNPWRVYYSAILWNPGFLFLAGAVHLWSIHAQRHRARFGASFALALAIGLSAQLHPSALILLFAAALLAWRGYFRPSWWGLLAGGALASLTLVPWIFAVQADPSVLPGGKGFLFRGLVLVLPMLSGVLYWLRYSTFMLMDRMARPDLTLTLGAAGDAVAAPVFDVVRECVGVFSLLVAGVTTWHFFKRHLALLRRSRAPASDRGWLAGYAVWVAAGALLSFGLSPTTIMGWQGFIALHAAVLPPVLILESWLRTSHGGRWRRLVPGYAVATVFLLFTMAWASPDYRCGGRRSVRFPLLGDHPMFQELKIDERCPFPVDPIHGWWPDALPKPGMPQ